MSPGNNRDSYQWTSRLFTSLLNSTLCSAQAHLCPSVPSRKPKYLPLNVHLSYLPLRVKYDQFNSWGMEQLCHLLSHSILCRPLNDYVQGIKTPTDWWYASYDFSHHLILIISKYPRNQFFFFPIAHISVKRKTLWHLGRLAFSIRTYHVIQLVVYIFFLKHPGPLDGYRSSYKNLLY